MCLCLHCTHPTEAVAFGIMMYTRSPEPKTERHEKTKETHRWIKENKCDEDELGQ